MEYNFPRKVCAKTKGKRRWWFGIDCNEALKIGPEQTLPEVRKVSVLEEITIKIQNCVSYLGLLCITLEDKHVLVEVEC